MKTVTAISVTLALGVLGCKQLTAGDNTHPNYASDADTNMKLGNDALANKGYAEAQQYFEYVHTKYPYLEIAKTAELRIADTDFEREHFQEARDKYLNFVKLHPLHAKVDYAAYRAALTHFKEIPGDLFILPPSYEKEQTEVRGALKAMTDFAHQYPNSSYILEMQKDAVQCRRRLAEHEIYVAEFYAKRERWPAVVLRYQSVVQEYSGAGFDEKALFGLHNAYTKLHDAPHAAETLRTIISRFPGTPAAAKAGKMLGS